ncbi:hypothetical protein GCM10010515_71660 [Streptomyces fructofermentans]|uniref:Uncharacterized protein n=1 Tax=Streptomyces fructofermentans TaxID=152141 RepID=A0A918NTD7_9ACTN|nr:hypothetical protein GCM10010515_71660 [Streptomyces fructofermentans]
MNGQAGRTAGGAAGCACRAVPVPRKEDGSREGGSLEGGSQGAWGRAAASVVAGVPDKGGALSGRGCGGGFRRP